MRSALIAFLALWVVALACVILTPSLLVVDQYRNKVAQFASARLGRPVHIDGPISLTLLPEPMLSAAGVTVGDSGDGVTVAAAELALRVAIWPLIRGRVDARELVLRGADMRVPWPPSRSLAALGDRPWFGAMAARIDSGTLEVGGLQLTDLVATVTADGWTGSYAATGTARLGGIGWRFDSRVDGFGGIAKASQGPARLRLSLEGEGPAEGAATNLSGELAPDGSVSGQVDAHGPDMSRIFAAPAAPFTVRGRMTATYDRVAANELDATLGALPARIGLALQLLPSPRLDLKVSATRLELDPWLPILSRPGNLPMPIGLDVWAETAGLQGGRARVVHGLLDLSPAGVTVREARAVLPGDAIFSLKGRLETSLPARAQFLGDASLTAPALSTTLAWLQQAALGRVTPLPDRAMRTADLTVRVSGEPGVLSLTNLQGRLDGTALTGSLSLRTAGRPMVGAGITLDRLDLDPWLPSGLGAFDAMRAAFSDIDADLRLEARQASLAGVTAVPMLLDVAAEAGRFTLRQLAADANGVHVAVSGAVSDSGNVTDASVSLQTLDAAGITEQLTTWLGPSWLSPAILGTAVRGLLHGPASLQLQATGVPTEMHLDTSADIAGLHAEFRPVIDLRARRWQGPVTLRHPGAPRLASRLGALGVAAWLGEGSLGLVAQMSGIPGRLWADRIDLAAGSLRADGSLALALGQRPPRLAGAIRAESLPLPPLPLRSIDPLPLDWLAGWEAAVKLTVDQATWGVAPVLETGAATISLEDGVLTLGSVTGEVAGGKLTGQARFASSARPPEATLDATLLGAELSGPLADLPIDIAGGTIDAGTSLRAFGYAPSVFLATVAGDAHMTVRDGTLIGLGLDRLRAPGSPEATIDALCGGSTQFSVFDLAARVRNGIATLDRSIMTSDAGELRVDGRIDVPASVGDLRFDIRPASRTPPTIVLRLAGPLDHMERIPDFAGLERSEVLR